MTRLLYKISKFYLKVSCWISRQSMLSLDHDPGKLQALLKDRIHYGCGKIILKEWLNVDGFNPQSCPKLNTEIVKQIYPVNLASSHPFPDNYFNFGFSEDFLEHLDQAESLIFLSECYRTFAKGGVLRLSFPDLRNVLKRHYRTSDYEGANKGREEAYTMWGHKHFYCFESLKWVVEHIGFREIEIVKFGESRYKELRNLEKRQDQIDLNLIVEITK